MEIKIRAYVESLFRNTPPTQQAVELREELIQNLIEKYHDFLQNGKSEEAAYNLAIASIGDISGLLRDLGGQAAPNQVPFQVPNPQEQEKRKKQNAVFVTTAVMFYILCFIPVLLFPHTVGVVLMFLMIAVATGLLIYNSEVNRKKADTPGTVVEDFRSWQQESGRKKQIYSAISTAIWVLTLALYFLISFTTHAWYITWLLFLIGGAIAKMAKVIIYEICS